MIYLTVGGNGAETIVCSRIMHCRNVPCAINDQGWKAGKTLAKEVRTKVGIGGAGHVSHGMMETTAYIPYYCRFEHVCSKCFGGHRRDMCQSRREVWPTHEYSQRGG